jgi:hypothetical protein
MRYFTIKQSNDYGHSKEWTSTKRVLLGQMRKLAFNKRATARKGWNLERFGGLPVEAHQSPLVTMEGSTLYNSGLVTLIGLLNAHGSQRYTIQIHA